MANPEHLAILKQGVEVWNMWRENNQQVIPNFSNAYLNNMNLIGANLRGSDLSGAALIAATLRGADLCDSNFGNLKFVFRKEGILKQANLRNCIENFPLSKTILNTPSPLSMPY